MNYLDCRHNIVQAFEGKRYDPATNKGPLTKNMVEKIARSGLTYEDLKKLHIKCGEVGLIAILSKPPCGSMSSSSIIYIWRSGSYTFASQRLVEKKHGGR